MSLKKLVEEHNKMETLFGGKDLWSMNPGPEMAQQMFSRLDSNLSPEALYADGERPAAQARKLAAVYHKAIEELKALGHVPAGKYYNM